MRLRAEYRLGPGQRFLANLDTMHMMERALRRAGLPYALSSGFNPHIRLSMGTVLPVGIWGEKEYFDLDLIQPMEPDDFVDRLNKALPSDVELRKAVGLASQASSLMKTVNAASYNLRLEEDYSRVDALARELISRPVLPVKSRGKKKGLDKDLRSGIYKVDLQERDQGCQLSFWVAVGEPLNVRYDELLDMLTANGLDRSRVLDIYRTGNYLYRDDVFISPLEMVE